MLLRLVAIIVFLMLFFGGSGYYVVFKLEQVAIRKDTRQQLKRAIPHYHLREIIISVDEAEKIEWEEEGKEFWYKGSMYDVVSSSARNGAIHYYCIDDKEEARLFARLDKMVKDQQESKQNSPSKSLAKAFFSLVYYPAEPICLPFYSLLPSRHGTSLKLLQPQEFSVLHTPPPKSC